MRPKGWAATARSRSTHPPSYCFAMNARSSGHRASTAAQQWRTYASAQAMSSSRVANASSGSIIQNSARWRAVWLGRGHTHVESLSDTHRNTHTPGDRRTCFRP